MFRRRCTASPRVRGECRVTQPSDIAIRETVAFLVAHLYPTAWILEIGCNEGQVALALRDLGHSVLGLDSDPEIEASAARSR